jgi:hypothetical protein
MPVAQLSSLSSKICPTSLIIAQLCKPFFFFCGAGDQTQDFAHARQVLSLSYIPGPCLHFSNLKYYCDYMAFLWLLIGSKQKHD